jgi:hypothetical protein
MDIRARASIKASSSSQHQVRAIEATRALSLLVPIASSVVANCPRHCYIALQRAYLGIGDVFPSAAASSVGAEQVLLVVADAAASCGGQAAYLCVAYYRHSHPHLALVHAVGIERLLKNSRVPKCKQGGC